MNNIASSTGFLLSNAVDLSVDILVTYGVSPEGIDILRSKNFVVVSDLINFTDDAGLSETDRDIVMNIHNSLKSDMAVNGAPAYSVKNTFVNYETPGSIGGYSIDDLTKRLAPQSCPAFTNIDFSSLVGENVDSFYLDATAPTEATTNISSFITDCSSDCPSVGSRSHNEGLCNPCAWYHHKDGCRHGESCEYCHLCPVGEIKRRKKEKQRVLKFLKGRSDNRNWFTSMFRA